MAVPIKWPCGLYLSSYTCGTIILALMWFTLSLRIWENIRMSEVAGQRSPNKDASFIWTSDMLKFFKNLNPNNKGIHCWSTNVRKLENVAILLAEGCYALSHVMVAMVTWEILWIFYILKLRIIPISAK